MGLLSTTYINNTTYNQVVSPKALLDNTKALKELSNSTKGLSKSIDRGRIKLTHKRYCELKNKSMLLSSIFDFINSYATLAYNIRSGEHYVKFNEILNYHRGVTCVCSGPIRLTDRITLIWDDNEKTCILEIDGSIFVVKEPNYIPETDGEVNINEDEYNTLLNRELLLEDYSKSVEELPSLLYKLMENKFYYVDSESRDSISHWITYCNQGRGALHRDYNMDYTFGPIKTKNFKWELTTKIGNSQFKLRLIK